MGRLDRQNLRPSLAFLVVFCAVCGVFVFGWRFSERQENEALRLKADLGARQVAGRIETYFSTRLDLLRHVRDGWMAGPLTHDRFVEHAREVQQRFSGIVALNYIDPAGTIRWVVPEDGNRAALDRDLTGHPVAAPTLHAAATADELRVTPHLELYQGGLGFSTYLPVVQEGQVQGFVSAVFRIAPGLVECIHATDLELFDLRVLDGPDLLYGEAPTAGADAPVAASASIAVGDRTWRVVATPTPHLITRSKISADEWILGLGIVLGLLLAAVFWRLMISRETVQASRERYRSVVEDMPALVCRFKPDTTLTFVNRAYADYFRRTPEDLLGRSFLELVPADQHESILAKFRGMGRAKSTIEQEHEVLGADGAPRWQRWFDRALFDAKGEIGEFQSIGIDITENRLAHQALRASEARFRTIFAAVHDGVLLLDAQGRVLDVNDRACELYGLPREQLVGSELTEIDARPDQPHELPLADWFLVPFDERQPSLIEWQVPRASGKTFWGEIHLRTAMIDDVPRVVGVLRDVTERQELGERLRQAQKLEAIGTLAGGIAHDFNNILTAIGAHAERAASRGIDDAVARESLAGIEEACRRAAALTRSILTFSRGEIAVREPVDLTELISSTLAMLGPILPRTIEVVTEAPRARQIHIVADRSQIQQVLINLAINARDAMPLGGQLRIAVEDAGAWVDLIVEDTGSGMTDEVKQRVLEPFFTTKPRERGTGLGLAVVHGIVLEHEGEIEIETAPGRGTRVRVRLPMAACAPTGVVERDPVERVIDAPGGTILVVDDCDSIRELVAEALRGSGYDVLEAADGLTALGTFTERQSISLLILDLDLPKLSGADCLSRLREAGHTLPVVLISGDPDRAIDPQAPPPGTVFLQKPFRIVELKAIVDSCLTRSASVR